uniref:AAA domain protein n=1 Tax=Marseillevirus LCMAC101 TaxID=2506602 RepID=A0A481YR44_9VIRU|nr:MAG: AAA domain protein [Marseillevirus LCMAC101]
MAASYADRLKAAPSNPAPQKALPNLLLVGGPSGSGKTTIANWHKQYGFNPAAADDFFYKNGVYKFDKTKLSDAHKGCFSRTKTLLLRGYWMVVHNTFITLKELEPYLELEDIATITIYSVKSRYTSDKEIPQYVLDRQISNYEPHPREKGVVLDQETNKLVFS